MAILSLPKPPFFLYIFLIMFPVVVKAFMNDADALLRIKQSLNNPQPLDSWKLGTAPCDDVIRWVGLVCNNGIVTNLHLKSMSLSGDIDLTAMAEMAGLRIISLENNSFSGPVPEFNKLGSLKALYLSMNQFSGEIPPDYFTEMRSLKKIWLNDNKFTGQIPSSITQLPNLVELRLEKNQFSGAIPAIGQQSLESLNLSYNNLSGEVPSGLGRFDAVSFEGNPGLCGAKFGKVCDKENAKQSPKLLKKQQTNESLRIEHLLMVICVLIIAIMIVVIFVLKQKNGSETVGKKEKDSLEGSVGLTISSTTISKPSAVLGQKSFGTGQKALIAPKKAVVDLMLLNNNSKEKFGLADLMKAAAEVLGNGVLGSSYKATMSNGMTVVVKRLKKMNMVDKDGFKAEMKKLGSLNHPNILTPLACHYRKEEKLLIHDYISRGSLLYLLHGYQGKTHAELSWAARLKIIQGIAQGMGYIHTQLSNLELPHGNLKSSNVLLGPDYQPLVVDFGLHHMINTNQAASALAGYKAPESAQSRQVSPKCDVYCLGIIILETLTGKCPSQYVNNGQGGTDVVQWVNSAMVERRERELLDPEIAGSSRYVGEMEKLLHIGAACTESDPEVRLDIREAIRRIENIEGGDERTIQTLDGYADAGSTLSEPFKSSRNANDTFAFRVS